LSTQGSLSKDEIIDMVVANNMVDKLVRWLESRGFDTSQPVRLEELSEELLIEFARENGLLSEGEEPEEAEGGEDESIDRMPEEVEQRFMATKAKKIRQKK